jgi:hypothetical protein
MPKAKMSLFNRQWEHDDWRNSNAFWWTALHACCPLGRFDTNVKAHFALYFS